MRTERLGAVPDQPNQPSHQMPVRRFFYAYIQAVEPVSRAKVGGALTR